MRKYIVETENENDPDLDWIIIGEFSNYKDALNFAKSERGRRCNIVGIRKYKLNDYGILEEYDYISLPL